MTHPSSPRALSAAQEQAWLLSRLVRDSPLPHVACRLELHGTLDPDALVSAFRSVLSRHPSIGARFDAVDGTPLPLGARPDVPVTHHDVCPFPRSERTSRVDELVSDTVRAPFDPARGLLVRAGLIRGGEREHILVVVTHRLVCDRASLELLVSQTAAAYEARVTDQTDAPPHASESYSREPQAPAPHPPENTPEPPPAPELPWDRPIPLHRDLRAQAVLFDIPEPASTALRTREGRGLDAALLAAYLVLLHRYSGQSDLIVSVPAPGRRHPGDAGVPGCFESEVAVRCAIHATLPFRELVREVRRQLEAATAGHGAALGHPGFSYRAAPRISGDVAGLTMTYRPEYSPAIVGDLALHLTDDGDRLSGHLLFATDVFDESTARRAVGHLSTLLLGVTEDLDRPVAELPLLTADEERIFDELNSVAADPPDRTFSQLFEEQAARTPGALALRADGTTLTYRELNARANQLAHLLRELGVGPEVTVGIRMERCPEMVVAVLGILKAGGAYVPVDPRDPVKRRDGILSDAGVSTIVVAGAAEPGDLGTYRIVALDTAWTALRDRPAQNTAVAPGALSHAAYLLYTSGSTGRPKGVVVENRQLVSYTMAVISRFGIDGPMRCAMVQPLTVDSSVTMLTPPLCTGGELHLIARDTALDANKLADWVARWGVDFLKIAPSHLRALQSSPRFPELLPRRLLVVGGEASDWRWLREIQRSAPNCRVFNHYGPTETTVGVLALDVSEHLDAEWDTAPLGVPLPGTQAHVVDEAGRALPAGVAGELLIGGANLARGYHRHDDLTATAFGPATSDEPKGPRLYRTGDMVRRLADGTIAFLGRRDDQIKVRGFRVDLGEIDAALGSHPGVRNAATVVREDKPGDRRIVAYYETVGPGAVGRPELERHLYERLSPHMVPRSLVVLPRIPLSAHGKVDRAALPAPAAPGAGEGPALPLANELERVVAAVWQDVLHTESVRADQNFFDVGGHSLLLVELQHRLQAAAGREVELLSLFQHTTVRAQAALLSGRQRRPERPRSERQSEGVQQNALLKRRQQQLRARRGQHE
ncbi:amino acid adenylation domain-containing protein [Streptomyces sp. NPDC059679]|uniref:non-ribosomal peptide synthetase n=1 Tax=Streptomyces sp. NPDC059679 TaxID=3346903 RepID=UPI0036AA16A2